MYSNDDFFLLRATSKQDFFYSNGVARLRLEAHGIVNGAATEGEPDYLNGARNASSLLGRDFGAWPVRLHTHSPQSMNRDVLAEMEGRYPDEFAMTRSRKFRHFSDVAVSGFFYHHYAFVTGRAVPDGQPTLLIQQNHRFERMFANILQLAESAQRSPHLSVCVNDGNSSHENPAWEKAATRFLRQMFPEPSQFEVQS